MQGENWYSDTETSSAQGICELAEADYVNGVRRVFTARACRFGRCHFTNILMRYRPQSHMSLMPVPPVPARSELELEGLSRSQRKATLHEHRAKLLARDVIRAGNELWKGGPVTPDYRRIGKEVWERADVSRILEDCKEHDISMTAAQVTTPTGHAALSQLAKVTPSGYGSRGQQKGELPSSIESSVCRGEIVSA